jgi:hypothetical protein
LSPLTTAPAWRIECGHRFYEIAPMLDDVVDVRAVAKPALRSPNTKAALAYLEASGATAISIDEAGGIRTGKAPAGLVTYWVRSDQATAICRRARRHASRNSGPVNSTAALRRAAGELRVVLTENSTALTRATAQANQLTEYMETLNKNGGLKEFNRLYKLRRTEAAAAGCGYASYASMLARLRRTLIPVLASGDPQARAQFRISEILE